MSDCVFGFVKLEMMKFETTRKCFCFFLDSFLLFFCITLAFQLPLSQLRRQNALCSILLKRTQKFMIIIENSFLSLNFSLLTFHQAATASFFAALAFTISSTNISKHTSASCGPGLASGWY